MGGVAACDTFCIFMSWWEKKKRSEAAAFDLCVWQTGCAEESGESERVSERGRGREGLANEL